MEPPDLLMTVVTLAMPPILFLLLRSKLRSFLYSVAFFWMMLIAGGQYHLAYTPGYDSVAPGLSIVAGWIPAVIYASFVLAVSTMFEYVNPKTNVANKPHESRLSKTDARSPRELERLPRKMLAL